LLNGLKLARLDQSDEFIPLGMGQPYGIGILADGDALICDLDLRAKGAVRAKGDLDRFHLDLVLDGSRQRPYCL
jgi:hypothetical protein